jgi:2-oxoglutarate ferredoxin oxidoreductase subunit beta
MTTASLPVLSAKDFATDQTVRWCPGCGDYSVLTNFQHALAGLGLPRERVAVVSGFGCAGRLPYYLNTYGFHTLPGRALPLAVGLKTARPDLTVWVAVGEGDTLGPGVGALLHAVRRNVDIKILLFNNEVLGLTKGQASPAARVGTRTRTTPQGSTESDLKPLPLALAAGLTFAARTADVDAERLLNVVRRATFHRGTAIVEVYQNCHVYNDGAFDYATDPSIKAETTLELENGKPLIFGADRERGVRMTGPMADIVELRDDVPLDDILVHDESLPDPTQAWILSRMTFPEYPECFGVFRAVDRPTLDETVHVPPPGPTRALQDLLAGDDPWTVV